MCLHCHPHVRTVTCWTFGDGRSLIAKAGICTAGLPDGFYPANVVATQKVDRNVAQCFNSEMRIANASKLRAFTARLLRERVCVWSLSAVISRQACGRDASAGRGRSSVGTVFNSPSTRWIHVLCVEQRPGEARSEDSRGDGRVS